MPAWQRAQLPPRLIVDSKGQEALQMLAPLVQDAESGVARVGQIPGHLENAMQYTLDVQRGHDLAREVEHPPANRTRVLGTNAVRVVRTGHVVVSSPRTSWRLAGAG